MTKSWTVRKVSPGDTWTVASHRYYRGEPRQDINAYSDWLPPRIERGTYIGFVAEGGGLVIAGAGAVLLDWGPTRGDSCGTRARIVNVFTQPEWRKQGIARTLIGRVMTACSGLGICRYSLAASAEGEPMYRSLGFEPYAGEMILRCG
jgi:GNAT superfamily N-acetyltransferase